MTLIIVSGTRYATDANREQIEQTLRPYGQDFAEPVTLRHGAARGVDSIAADIAARWGWTVDPHPARWRECGMFCPPRPHLLANGSCPFAGHRRNHVMLTADPRPTVVVAFPGIGSGASGKGGTWDFMRRAVDLGYAIDRVVPLAVEVEPAALPGLDVVRGEA